MSKKAEHTLLSLNNERNAPMYTSDGTVRRAVTDGKIMAGHFVNEDFKKQEIFCTDMQLALSLSLNESNLDRDSHQQWVLKKGHVEVSML